MKCTVLRYIGHHPPISTTRVRVMKLETERAGNEKMEMERVKDMMMKRVKKAIFERERWREHEREVEADIGEGAEDA